MLKEVVAGTALLLVFERHDLLARLGGDELVVLFEIAVGEGVL